MPSIFGYMLILDILSLVGTQPEQGNKSLDIIRRNETSQKYDRQQMFTNSNKFTI